MNRTYALVWNPARQCWTAVGETARRHGKSGGGKRLAAVAVSLLGIAASPAFALPSGEAVASGKADIVRGADGRTMDIHQHTDKLVTNWQDFSVAGGERVSFHQPTDKSLALNRVIGGTGSRIDGQLNANGRVFLVNPNGVLFGAGAQVNVGSLVASTQNLSDDDFLAGRYRFSGASTQAIANHGTITAADGGGIALLGARVTNQGVIQAKLGRVALGAGNDFMVNFDGNGLLNVQVERGAVDALASNGGLLRADGGEVLMTARSAGNLLDAVVNNTGTIEARGLQSRGGRITLDGGTVKVGGKLDASAAEAGAPAGSVVTRGERVDVADDAQVDTRTGATAGTWTIEAANTGVNGVNGAKASGRSISANALSRNLGTTNVELVNTRADLAVGGPVAWTSDNALTLTAKKGSVNLLDTLSAAGANAALFVNAADRIRVNDAVRLTGRNAHLELDAKHGHTFTNGKAVVTLSGQNASYRANGEDYKVLHTLDDLRTVDGNLGGRYVVGNAIDGNNANFRSIGGGATFSGIFDGLGNTLSRLNISNPGQNVVGLFGANTGTVANLTLQTIRTTGAAQPNGTPLSIGTLAGYNRGTISNVSARDVVVTAGGNARIGGLVGSNFSGTIDGARVSGRIEGDRQAAALGGLVGENVTVLWPQSPAATIRNSHADVQLTAALDGAAGGLVGFNNGTIEGSSSAGRLVAIGEKAMIGGLVGVNERGGVIRDSSSSAVLSTRQNAVAGGLVGANGGTIAGARATGAVIVGDRGIAGGLVGVNNGDVDASRADGLVVAGATGTAGGLAGSNAGRIAGSQANGGVTAGASSRAGGLVGFNEGAIHASAATGAVLAAANSVAGGLVGHNAATGDIRTSAAHGGVKVTGKGTLGGFAGINDGYIDGAVADGAVVASDDSIAGGLVGANQGVVAASRASGIVNAGKSSSAGGLVGVNAGRIESSQASGNVSAGVSSAAGGLAAINLGTVKDALATGSVLVGIAGQAGGLVGRNGGAILLSEARGSVKGGNLAKVGGLVGLNDRGTVSQSRASGAANGGDNSEVGGLAGNNGGKIEASASSGTVSGGRNARLGGLVGANFGYVGQSTTGSRVVTTNGYDQMAGLLAGLNLQTLVGNRVTGNGGGLPLVDVNFGILKD